MKKILLVFDGINFSDGAFEFARRLNDKEKILITAVFVPQFNYANLWSYADTTGTVLNVSTLEDEEAEQIEKNIERFQRQCEKSNLEYRIHKEVYEFAIPQLKKETRFADVLIIGSESFYSNIGIGEPNDFLKMALHDAECPVVVVPEKFQFPKNNILSYDGSESSAYAIKQFAYLFPELKDQPTLLVYSRDESDDDIPDEEYIEESAARQYSDLTVMKLHFDPKEYFATWAENKQESIVVSGSFGRSSTSRLFKKSFIKNIIKEHRIPVFIAHR